MLDLYQLINIISPQQLLAVCSRFPDATLVEDQAGNLAILGIDDVQVGFVDVRTGEYETDEETDELTAVGVKMKAEGESPTSLTSSCGTRVKLEIRQTSSQNKRCW